ncbi:MAG: radical SAM protein [Micromonosporaceae bacterium]
MEPAKIAVVSAFEARLQPILAASAAGALRNAGARVTAWDADVCPNDFPGSDFDLVLISIPSYEGIEAGARLATRFKAAGVPRVLACGQYAWLNAEALASVTDGVLVDEPEGMTTQLLAYARGEATADQISGILTGGRIRPKPQRRITRDWQLPARDLFPPITSYPEHDTKWGLLGNIEATRGCHHRCSYCAVYAAYGVAAIPIDQEMVLADAAQLVAQGARHFAFVDAEFFNTRRHALNVMQAIAERFGPLTFELTTRFDHILEFEAEISQMTALGLRVITSALEFPSEKVLEVFDKGIDVPGIKKAIRAAKAAGVELRPTFITFTPWVGLDDIQALDDFMDETGIAGWVDHTARQTRLLLFKGSPLLGTHWLDGVELIDRGFYYDWKHPDPAVDELWAQRRQEAVEAGATRCCVRC